MVIKNNLVPFKGFVAMAAWTFIFVRKDWFESRMIKYAHIHKKQYDKVINHEKIHLEQQSEVSSLGLGIAITFSLIFGFYWWVILFPIFLYYVLYGLDYLLGVVSGEKEPYKNICFEREAYAHEKDQNYLDSRIPFAWIKYNVNNPKL